MYSHFIFLVLSTLVFSVSYGQQSVPAEIIKPKSQSKTQEPSVPQVAKEIKKRRTRSKSDSMKPSAPRAGSIGEVVVSGNKKIEKDAILGRIRSQVGARYSEDLIREDIQSIFKLGYFYDVEVSRESGANGLRLTFKVVEKPSVIEIVYRGQDEIDESDLKEAVELKPYQILDISTVQKAKEKLEKLYEEKGFFLAQISYAFEPIKKENPDQVRLVFTIVENDKVKVKSVQFIGNRKVSDSDLKAVMGTKEEGFFSFISNSGAYKQELFDRDMQVLSFYYFNKGYVQVKISKPLVSVSPDKKGIYIAIRIEEGEQFDVGDIDFQGDLLFPSLELSETIKIDEESTFVAQTLQEDVSRLQAKYGDLGYAYANIIPLTTVREKDRKVDITFKFEKGNKVYFGQFNIVGNSRTRDKVIRRELEIFEGELYNETKKRESVANVRRLGFFDEMNFNSKTPSGQPDVMDLEVAVTERNTGQINVGAGYSTYSKLNFQGMVQQSNFLGRGQKLGVGVQYSARESTFNLNFTEPYVYDTEWTFGFDLYRSKKEVQDIYERTKRGGAIRIGHPLAPYLRGFVRYKNDVTDVDLESGDPLVFPVDTVNGRTSSLTFTLEYDKRDDRLSPQDGIYANASIEYAGVGGDKEYTMTTGTFRFYQKIIWDLVWRNNISYGLITAPSGRKPPFDELFLLGGANSLRGYQFGRVGKQIMDSTNKLVPFGGEQELYFNTEFEFPLISEAGIKGVIFYDMGQAEDDIAFSEFRSNYGFGFRWFSPIGPLRFEWGFPLDRKPNETGNNFEFSIGAPF